MEGGGRANSMDLLLFLVFFVPRVTTLPLLTTHFSLLCYIMVLFPICPPIALSFHTSTGRLDPFSVLLRYEE